MTKLIKNWEELSKIPPNDKYQIIVDRNMCCGHIVPITDEPTGIGDDYKCNCTGEMYDNYFKHHTYLSTHTFYGSNYEHSTEILQKYGFDVEIDNWDKGRC